MVAGNQFISDSSEDSSSGTVELVVDKNKEEYRNAELARENNIYNFDAETIKDKPWLKPGADITDYFNYGFTEQSWMKYCEMQRENREFSSRHNRQERNRRMENEERRRYREEEDERYRYRGYRN